MAEIEKNRRQVLKTVAAAGAAGALAGCSSNEDDGGNNLGERVPTLEMQYYSDMGGITQVMEVSSPVIQENIQNKLGVSVNISPVATSAQMANKQNDERNHHFNYGLHTNTPDRLDPHELIIRESAHWAGAQGSGNNSNYANCEYTNYAVQQARAPNNDVRETLVNRSQEIISHDVPSVPIVRNPAFGAARVDTVNTDGIGDGGVAETNPSAFILSEPAEGNRMALNVSPGLTQTTNYMTSSDSALIAIWSHLINSTLVEYDENLELQNVLAENYELSNDASEMTVQLREGTFHNGDPITAEDVKFTFEFLANNPGAFPQAGSPPYESIEAVDERTVRFNLEESFLPLVSRVWPRWGILHKASWEENGAHDNPTGNLVPPGEFVGSGPFRITDHQEAGFIRTEAHDGHPFHEPDHGLTFEVFQDETSAFRAFESNTLQFLVNISGSIVEQIQEDLADVAEVLPASGFVNYRLTFQWPIPPTKFTAFNSAVGAAINRERINEVAFAGLTEPEMAAIFFSGIHPWRPPDDMLYFPTEDPTGSEEDARGHLEDAGWGWDDDGNLHYPTDANLDPRWPDGEVPHNLECVTEDSEYNQTEDVIAKHTS